MDSSERQRINKWFKDTIQREQETSKRKSKSSDKLSHRKKQDSSSQSDQDSCSSGACASVSKDIRGKDTQSVSASADKDRDKDSSIVSFNSERDTKSIKLRSDKDTKNILSRNLSTSNLPHKVSESSNKDSAKVNKLEKDKSIDVKSILIKKRKGDKYANIKPRLFNFSKNPDKLLTKSTPDINKEIKEFEESQVFKPSLSSSHLSVYTTETPYCSQYELEMNNPPDKPPDNPPPPENASQMITAHESTITNRDVPQIEVTPPSTKLAVDKRKQEENILLELFNQDKIKIYDKYLTVGNQKVDLTDIFPPTSPTEQMEIGSIHSPPHISRDRSNSFITPRKTVKLATLLNSPTQIIPITTKNRFDNIRPLETENQILAKSTGAIPKIPQKSKQAETKQSNKTPKNPPIVIKGTFKNHSQLTQEIKNQIKKGFSIKYAPKSTLLYIDDCEEYKKYKKLLLNQEDLEFHTYTSKEDKTHAFVLRGLNGNPDLDELKEELEEHISVKNIFIMKTKRTPLFLVITTSDITLKHLQQNVRYLLHTKIEWEIRRNDREISQCRRCQMWGHATTNCHRAPRCVKCSEMHLTKDCSKPAEAPPKCANCGGDHTASNIVCEIYQFRLKQLHKNKQTENHPEYVAAPVPTTNAWEVRRSQATPSQAQPTTNRRSEPTRMQAEVRTQPTPSTRQREDSGDMPGDFNKLTLELNKLNNKIDLKETIAAIAHLNQMLENVNDAMQIIMVMQDFAKNILPLYKINV